MTAQGNGWVVHQGDCLDVLRTLPTGSVQVCVTSPPYFGLRNYDVEGQIGLEETPSAYVAKLVEVFREVKRVLRDDGTVWLNLGDSYAGMKGASGYELPHKAEERRAKGETIQGARNTVGYRKVRTLDDTAALRGEGYKPKSLLGIPWRVAFALQDDGWILRSDIIWAKSNPMPESVKDRPTKAHEYIFLFAKQPRYYYDADAVREQAAYDGRRDTRMKGSPKSSTPLVPGQTAQSAHVKGAERWQRNERGDFLRNRRSVWTVSTTPYKGAHFAVFPPKLIEPCVLAGTSERGVCPKCGAPYKRVVEKPQPPDEIRNRGNGSKFDFHTRSVGGGQKVQDWYDEHPTQTVGWQPSCGCNAGDPIPATVLDPFAGSGTTGEVAAKHGRSFVGIELNPEYIKLAEERLNRQPKRLAL